MRCLGKISKNIGDDLGKIIEVSKHIRKTNAFTFDRCFYQKRLNQKYWLHFILILTLDVQLTF